MATIRKRSSSWNVQIRKKGHPLLSETFKDRKTALAWAKKVESEIDRYVYLDISAAQRTTVSNVLDRFSKEVLPTKKSGDTGFTPPSRTHLKRPIMCQEVCHAKTQRILAGV
jgi:hypothetical protein